MSSPPLTPSSTQRSSPVPFTPTPTKRPILATPASILSHSSSTATLVDLTGNDDLNDKEEAKKLDAAFELHDYLVKEGHEDCTFPFFATVGQQSSAKSSVLSALLKIPLYSEQGQATHGPTLIHSRFSRDHFEASIQIELKRPSRGSDKRVDFTSSKITDLDTLRKALKLAGEEARRIGNVSWRLRTYEDIVDNEDGEEDSAEPGSGFTANIVMLSVEGPEQANITIVDLPGLNGDEFVNSVSPPTTLKQPAEWGDMVDEYLAKEECTAIFCHAAGGSDPNPDNKDWELILKARPTGNGVLGIITKADHIDVSDASPEVKLIKGEPVRNFKPEHGWLPLRLRISAEREMSDEMFLSVQEALFRTPAWGALARKLKLDFGIEATESVLCEINHGKVLANKGRQLERLRQLEAELQSKIQASPAADLNPVGLTYDIIREIESSLHTLLTRRAAQADELFSLQKRYGSYLVTSVPELLPFSKQHVDVDIYEELVVCGHKVEGRTEHIYFDEIIKEVQSRYVWRNRTCDISDVRLSLIRQSVDRWRDLSLAHVAAVWSLVAEQTKRVTYETCAGKPALQEALDHILLGEHAVHTDRLRTAVLQGFDIEYNHDPRDIDDWDGDLAGDLAHAQNHFETGFARIYPAQHADGTSHTRVPPESTPAQRAIAFELMADVTIALEYGSGRWYQSVGRLVQASVLTWLKGIATCLYQALEMNVLQEGPAKRIGDLCEPDVEARKERDALAKKKRDLEMIQRRFSKA